MNPETAHVLWREFHAACESLRGAELLAWLAAFDARVDAASAAPGTTCHCGLHWRTLRGLYPPPAHADATDWGVLMHDRVNMRLGKPLHAPGLRRSLAALPFAVPAGFTTAARVLTLEQIIALDAEPALTDTRPLAPA